MSIRPMTWALYEAPVTDPTQLLILWAMADRANDDGTACWASNAWIADRARCSVRTVQRNLRALEDAGIIRRGDQQLVAHFRANHRPVVWDINMVTSARPRGDSLSPETRGDTAPGVTPVTGRGDTGGTAGVTLLSHNTSLIPYGDEHFPDTSTPPGFPDVTFNDFWAVYPRHTEKTAARTAWTKAVRTTDPAVIVSGAARHRDDPNREAQYTKHPATWLNKGCWDDEALPARRATTGPAATQQHYDDLFGAALTRAQTAEVNRQQQTPRAIGDRR